MPISLHHLHLIRIVYLSFYQAVFQYGIKFWDDVTENVIKPLELQQNKIIRVCLSRNKDVVGSTIMN